MYGEPFGDQAAAAVRVADTTDGDIAESVGFPPPGDEQGAATPSPSRPAIVAPRVRTEGIMRVCRCPMVAAAGMVRRAVMLLRNTRRTTRPAPLVVRLVA